MKRKKLFGLLTAVCMVGSCVPLPFTVVAREELSPTNNSTYSITIPAKLSVQNSGWNAIGNIKASGTLADGKELTLSATSLNGWNLKLDETNKIPYKLCEEADKENDYASATAVTSLEFSKEQLSGEGSTIPFGIVVYDYTGMKAGKYSDHVDFSAKVEDAAKIVDLSTITTNYTARDGEILTGTLGANVKISVADGATVTLKNAVINGDGNYNCLWAGISLEGDGTIILEGSNTVKGFYANYPGIYVPENKTLTIKGSGSLDASSNGFGTGIGGGYYIACGNIVIESGTITATGGNWAAGIGSGGNAPCGDITISGGTVEATGGQYAAGIGSGYYASCGNITITNGVTKVTATKGEDASSSIEAGASSVITIGGNVTGNISDSPYTYQPAN